MAAGDPGSPARYYSSTAVETALSGSIPAQSQGQANTSFIVASVSGFPSNYPYTLIVDPDTSKEEVVTVYAGSGTTLSVYRGEDNTQGVAHSAGAVVRHGVSGRDFRESENHIAARGYDIDQTILDAADQTHVHGIATGDGVIVGTLKAQTLTQKTLTTPTINGATITGTVTASAATFTSPTISGSPVITGLSSAGMVDSSAAPKNYVDSILGSATSAAISAASAAASATAAATSATSAANSATASASSASASATSASAAATSATSAAASATAAATSATSAAASATAAATSATSAAASQTAAATSATSASASATAAATSATSAAASATASASSATAASSSAVVAASYASAAPEFRQYGAEGSVLNNIPTRVHDAESLLKQAVWWIDSAHSGSSGQAIKNLGWGGSALDATAGSTTSADSNDPQYLAWDGTNYVYTPGVLSNYLSAPGTGLDITGDIDLRAQIAFDDWTPAATQTIMAKWSGALPGTSYRFSLLQTAGGDTSGALEFFWYNSSNVSRTASTTSSIVPAADGSSIWVRVTVDVDNGASGSDTKFFTSTNGSTWTQLGATVTTAGVTNIASNATEVRIGQRDSQPASAKIYRAQILNGIDGVPVLDVDTSVISSGSATSFTALTGQTVTINRSTSGRKTTVVTHPVWLFGTDDYMEVNNRWLERTTANYLYLPGVDNNFASAPDSAALDITGDIDVRVKVALDDWSPSTSQMLLTKWDTGSALQGAYRFNVDTAARLNFSWSPNGGTTVITAISTAAPTVVDGGTLWIRAILDVDNGASGNTVTFFTSNDGLTWTQLGATVTNAGVTSIFNSNQPIKIGVQNTANVTPSRGKFFRAQVLNGIGGTVAFDANFETGITTNLPTTFTESSANAATVTINYSGTGYRSCGVIASTYVYPGATNTFKLSAYSMLDFGATDNFTVVTAFRPFATVGQYAGIISKGQVVTGGSPGYSIIRGISDQTYGGYIYGNGGTAANYMSNLNSVFDVSAVVFDRGAQTLLSYTNGTAGTSQSISARGSLSNQNSLFIGTVFGANYADMEFVSAAVFRRALTAGEITTLNTYFQGRVG